MGSRLSITPVVSLPVVYFTRPSESCYVDEATVLSGHICYVHDDKKVNLCIFDKNGLPSGRIDVLLVAEGDPRPDPGKEFCVISPFVTADTQLMQTICERLNMLQEIVGRQQNRMTQKVDERPAPPPNPRGEQLSAANSIAAPKPLHGDKEAAEAVRNAPEREISQELDIDYDPPADEAGEKAKEEASGDL